MTKAEAKQFKENYFGKAYTTYYSSKTESMSVRVYSYINNAYNPETEKAEITNFMNLVKDAPFKYEVIHRTYQGFIHDTCIICK